MHASEAKKMAEAVIADQAQLNRFYESVKKTANNPLGLERTSMTYSSELISKPTVEFLIKYRGYKLQLIDDQRDGSYYKVSWKD